MTGEDLYVAKDTLSRAIEVLWANPRGAASEKTMGELLTRLQSAQNALVQNEKKIWLRMKAGKEMLGDFRAASERLRVAMESGSGLGEIVEALGEVEIQAKKLNEGSHRRSMVVTWQIRLERV